tara:strand:+ start:305 stop:448 length:144 start_codon:yes stop_codon:yes gene_type:complete
MEQGDSALKETVTAAPAQKNQLRADKQASKDWKISKFCLPVIKGMTQ